MKQVSINGINLIKKYEGCRLQAYWDKHGKVWTIGYGHTRGVTSGMSITQNEAIKYLISDCKYAENIVNKYDSVYRWNQNEFDALVSFAFNVGGLKKLTGDKTKTKQQIAEDFVNFNHAGGLVLPGLTLRRRAEAKLFTTPMEPEVKEEVKKGWQKDSNNNWTYTNDDGSLMKGWNVVNKHWYYFKEEDGIMVKGWNKINNRWYYMEESGDLEGALYKSDDTGAQSIWEV